MGVYMYMQFLAAIVFAGVVGCSTSVGSSGSSPAPDGGGYKCLCAASDVKGVKNQNPKIGTISVIGDSLASGYGAAPNSTNTPAQCLQKYFGTSVNAVAVPGATSIEVAGQIDSALQSHLVFVSSGGDDAIDDVRQPGSYPATRSLINMGWIFDRLLQSGALVVYLGLKPPYPGGDRMGQIWDLANSKGVLVVDGMSGLWTDKSLMADEIHPNQQGYSVMCSRIIATLKAYYP
jgi:lysophospholipase L1-like esterase